MKLLAYLPLFLLLSQAFAEQMEYKDGDTVLVGFIARPDAASGKSPAVIIVHDWMGPGKYTQQRAQQLADADRRSWEHLELFLKDIFSRAPDRP